MTYRKKLIEVSLPLEAINKEAAREKSIRHGHPSTLHLWWARRPLAACRAVLFSSLVDDPSEYMPDEESARVERERLFDIIEDLVQWENSNDEEILDRAKLEIARSVARNLGVDVPVGNEAVRDFLATKAPPVLDPFAGGGSIPLEAQRLGLRAYASDLNPVAVLINKALIEIPPKFANMPPIHPPEDVPAPKKKGKKGEGNLPLFAREWKGAQGLAEDVRYYGKWMRDEAYKRIGHLYPPITITKEMLAERPDLKEQGLKPGEQLTVIAWLWVRTVKCPNPACGSETPLSRSFALSKRKGNIAWIQPVIDQSKNPSKVKFHVVAGNDEDNTPNGTVNRNGATCIVCKTPIPFEYVRVEGQKKRMGAEMTAIVAEYKNRRVYLSASPIQEKIATEAKPEGIPDTDLPERALSFRVQNYGMVKHKDLFTNRQLVALSTFSDLVQEATTEIKNGISGVEKIDKYCAAVSVYLACAVDKASDFWSTLVTWMNDRGALQQTFSRQSLPMIWDFAEANPFSNSGGNFLLFIERGADALEFTPAQLEGIVKQSDAQNLSWVGSKFMLSTDPPYYDNIGYADLSDYFYVWLRKSLRELFPELLATVLVPKSQELVATPFRFGNDKSKAKDFFEAGLQNVFTSAQNFLISDAPATIYYAFKQTESNDDQDAADIESPINEVEKKTSTGWETMLQSLMSSGYEITGTWPIRTESPGRAVARGTNALASSIILVCRLRPQNTVSASRREFLSVLKRELTPALRELQQGSIAPVDLAQASIGPGMAVYSRYSSILEADGTPMSVRTALSLINQALDEYLAEQEGEYDGDTRWALSWYEQFGHNEAAFGVAETLSKAKNTSVNGLVEAGILEARGGKVRLLGRDELDHEWDPTQDKRPTAWEAVQHLIYALENEGEESAAGLLAKLGSIAEPARDLAYRLYTVCERKGWAQDALGYNMLVVAWPRLRELAAQKVEPSQGKLM